MERKDLVLGLVLGGIVGAALGVLLAPKNTNATRDKMREAIEDLYDKTLEQLGITKETMDEVVTVGKEVVAEEKGRIRKAVSAGLESLKETKAEAPKA